MHESNSPEIIFQKLQMDMPSGEQIYTEELLQGEIDDVHIEHIAYQGPMVQTIALQKEHTTIFLFIKGQGKLQANSITKNITPESIAVPSNVLEQIQLEIPATETLHFLKFTNKLSLQDQEDVLRFPSENKQDLYFMSFQDCVPYTEKIKSPNTVSRTVLPEHIVPRVALGTVEAMGPDKVGAHKHPMLEQLFLGLSDNEITVFADDAFAQLEAYTLLHIPLGSNHWVTVAENKKMNYMWMDFFLTRKGQEWLQTHQPITNTRLTNTGISNSEKTAETETLIQNTNYN